MVTENRPVVAWKQRQEGVRGRIKRKHKETVGVNGCLYLIVGMVSQVYTHTKTY